VASAKQIEANRRNAKRSTGPRTSAGKATVSLNAVKHGLLAQQVVLPNEDESEFVAFSLGLERELQPVGELEEFLVALIVASAWRLHRLMHVEKGLFIEYVYQRSLAGAGKREREAQIGPSVVSVRLIHEDGDNTITITEKLRSEAAEQVQEAEERAREAEERAAEAERLAERAGAIRDAGDALLGGAFIEDGQTSDAFSRLSRYEAHIQRSMYKALDQLQRLQATRNTTPNALAPLELEARDGDRPG
jgi:hypothetical protein